mmetsp:Transcript_4873/g.21000  ORF Transcript_4873/g.21000 Transcript_4873/m.21000 type:complete len:298 (+) Transcript_4873:810-1703(+)
MAFVGPVGVGVVSKQSMVCDARKAWRKDAGRVSMGLFDMFGNKEAANWSLDAGYASYPMVGKTRGEDAFFIEGNSLGVFDGVNSAVPEGMDAKAFSQFLAVNTSAGVRDLGIEKINVALNNAAEVNPEQGASTACVVAMDRLGRLMGINLGDSGALVARGDKAAYKSPDQSHFFNCPYQLGSASDDTVAMGKNFRFQLEEGDWVILASDGLWDNVYPAEIVRLINETVETNGEDPNSVANTLAQMAIEKSTLEAYTSPFAAEAKKNNVEHRGGKLDDVTVIASYVTRGAPQYSIVSA